MCIIIVLKNNKIDLETLKKYERKNPHGGGIAYVENNKVVIQKGLNSEEIWKISTEKELPQIIHFRFKSVGAIGKEYCHPFPFSDKIEDLKKTYIECETAFAHNGTVENAKDMLEKMQSEKLDEDISDTMCIALIVANKTPNARKEFLEYLCKKNTKNQKIAVINKNKKIEIFGEDWVEKNEIFFSNNNY